MKSIKQIFLVYLFDAVTQNTKYGSSRMGKNTVTRQVTNTHIMLLHHVFVRKGVVANLNIQIQLYIK